MKKLQVCGVVFGAVLALVATPVLAQTTVVSGLTIPPGASVTIEVDVEIAAPISDQVAVHTVCATGQVSGTGFFPVTSDDPATPTPEDATCTALPEYGDAPNDGSSTFYPTLAVDNGAVHALGSGVLLGASADVDGDGQAGVGSDGDDLDGNNDDDGVAFTSGIEPGTMASVDVTASAECGSVTCYLNAWMDFDNDGVWDSGEQIFTDQVVGAGVSSLSFVVPASAVANTDTYTRFRLSTASGLAFDGLATDGEVEDYRVTTVPVELLRFEIE